MGLVLAIERHSGEEMKLYRQEIIDLLSCFAADDYAMDRLVYRAARSLGILVSCCTVARLSGFLCSTTVSVLTINIHYCITIVSSTMVQHLLRVEY